MVGDATGLISVVMAAVGIYVGAAVLLVFGSFMTLWMLRTSVVPHEEEVEVVNLRVLAPAALLAAFGIVGKLVSGWVAARPSPQASPAACGPAPS